MRIIMYRLKVESMYMYAAFLGRAPNNLYITNWANVYKSICLLLLKCINKPTLRAYGFDWIREAAKKIKLFS